MPRIVQADVVAGRGGTVPARQRRSRDEVHRDPAVAVGVGEVVDADPRAGVVTVEVAPGSEVPVVVRLGLDPALSLGDHREAGEPRPLPDDDPDHHEEEGPVEQQAPSLAGEPLVGRDLRPVDGTADPEPSPTQHRSRPGRRLRRGVGHGDLRVVPEPVELPRRLRTRAEVAHERAGPRDQTGRERDQQQGVEQGEPPRAEHVEQPERVEDPRPQRMLAEVLSDPQGGVRPLRDQRTGDRGQRDDQQQDQRRAHRAQGAPHHRDRSAQRGERRGRRGGGHRRSPS